MKKLLTKICASLLCGTLLFSVTACGANGGSVSSQEQLFTDGIHVYDYTETDKYVVQNGQSDYKLVVSKSLDDKEKRAQDEMILLFEEATDVTLPIVTDAQISYNSENKVIVLGKNEYYRAALSDNQSLSTNGKNLEHDGFMIETVGNGIYIFGDYTDATLYGVYRYLELEFNFDCYSNIAYHLDKGVENVSLKDFSVIDVPDFQFRQPGYRHIINGSPTEWRMGFGMGGRYSIGPNSAHTAFVYLPKDKHQNTHEEWYSIDGTQLCYLARGNETEYEAMLNALLEVMKQHFKDSPNGYFFQLGHSDSKTWCSCDACIESKNKYGADSASVILLANRLAEKMDAWLQTEEGKPYDREYRITILAYGITLVPPTKYNAAKDKFEASAPEVICNKKVMPWYAPLEMNHNYTLFDSVNTEYYNDFMGWEAISEEMSFYLYSTNYRNFLVPSAFFDQLQSSYQLYASGGGYFIYDLGQNGQTSGATAWHILKTYLISKLSWNVNADVNELTQNFFKGYFGEASDAMMKFYQSYRVHAKYTVDNVYTKGANSVYMPLLDERYWPKDILDQWFICVQEALDSIEHLKRIDQKQWQQYYDRIALERISLCYMMVQLYENSCAEDFVLEMKLAFKEDCNRLGVMVSGEGGATVDDILKGWGL